MEQKCFHRKPNFRFKKFARKTYSAFNSIGKVVSIGCIAGTTLSLMSGSMMAQSSKTVPRTQVQELDEVVVTASLSELTLDEASRTIEVIPLTQIEQAPVQSINDLLNYLATVDVVQRGGHGVQTDLSIRGSSLDQVAILLNGINLSNAQTGHFALDFPINISDIERIEVLYGPSALVYGASAFSGGINIITKKDAEERLFAQVEWGMHKYRSLETRGALEVGNTVNSLSVGYKSSDGYIDNSDYDIYNLLWQTRLKLTNLNKIDFQLGYNDKKFGANTFYTAAYPDQYEETSSYLATAKGEFGRELKFTPSVYWNRHHDQFDLVRNTTTGQNFHRLDTYGANFTLSYKTKIGDFAIMSELRKDEIMSTKLGKPMVEAHRKYTMYDARTNWDTGLEYSLKLSQITASVGLMLNNNSFESSKYRLLPSASLAYMPTKSLKIYSSWSKSIRLPTFTDLYYTTETHTADDALRPEKTQSLEFGINYKHKMISTHLVGFASWGRNMIDWVKNDPSEAKWQSWNHSKINTKGVEAGIKFDLTHLTHALGDDAHLKVDYSYITQDLDTKSMISLYSLNYLKHKVVVNLHHNIYKGLSVDWFFRLQNRNGSYIEYVDNKPGKAKKYPTFSMLDLKLNYKIDNLNFHVNLNNIYDTDYYDLGNIPQSGFWLIGGLSYTLK